MLNVHQARGSNELGLLFQLMGPAFGATLLEAMLYGVHSVLFVVCIYLLWPRQASMSLVLLTVMAAMFCVSTADIAMTWRFVAVDLPDVLNLRISTNAALLSLIYKNYLFVTNNFLADVILLYRCYILWGRSRLVVALPLALLIADTVWGYLSQNGSSPYWTETRFTPVFLWSVFGFNVLLTLLTAGRICYIGRAYSTILGVEQPKGLTKAIVVILESGALYSLSILLVVAIPASHLKVHLYLLLIMERLVGIMPVLMIVQVELTALRQKRTRRTLGSDTTTHIFTTTTHPSANSATLPGLVV